MRLTLSTCLIALFFIGACGQSAPAEPAPAKAVSATEKVPAAAKPDVSTAKSAPNAPTAEPAAPVKPAKAESTAPKTAAAEPPAAPTGGTPPPELVADEDAHLASKDLPATYADDTVRAWLDVVLTTKGELHVDGQVVAKDAVPKLGSAAVAKGIEAMIRRLQKTTAAAVEVPGKTGLRAAATLVAALPPGILETVELIGARRIDGTHADRAMTLVLPRTRQRVSYSPEPSTTLDCDLMGAVGRQAVQGAVMYAVTIDGERVVARETDAEGKPTSDKAKVDRKAAKATGRLLRWADRAKKDATVRVYLDESLTWEAATQYVSAVHFACTDTAESKARPKAKRVRPKPPKSHTLKKKVGLNALLATDQLTGSGLLGSLTGSNSTRVRCGLTRKRAMRLEVHVCRKAGAPAAVATINPFKHAAPPAKRRHALGDALSNTLSVSMAGEGSALKIGSGAGGLGFRGTGAGGGGEGGGGIGGLGKLPSGTRGDLDAKAPVAKLKFNAITSTGSCGKADVKRGIRRRAGALRACYAKRVNADPTLQGDVAARFTVTPAGQVDALKLSGSLKDPVTLKCLNHVFSRLRFPKPETGTCAVTTKLTFSVSK